MTVTTHSVERENAILVLGSTGKLGVFLRRLWSQPHRSQRVGAWVARTPADTGMTRWTPGDDPSILPPADTLVALWGVTAGDDYALLMNTTLAIAALDLATAIGARRVLHCSSAAVYPGGPTPAAETDGPLNPHSAYGRSKRAMEQAIAAWSTAHPDGPRSCVMRLANVAGADQLFAAMDRATPLTLDRFPDGSGPRRSYIAPSDLGDVILALADAPLETLPPIVNVTGPSVVPMDDLLRAAGCPFEWRPAPDGALPVMALSDERLCQFVPPLTRSASADALIKDWQSLKGPAT